MPDPLLVKLRFDADFERAASVARRFDADLSHRDLFVFLECRDMKGNALLGRIDCTGYPCRPPDVRFLNPADAKREDASPSMDTGHWPTNPAPIKRDNGLHLCLAGTKSYLLFHSDPGHALSLSELVWILVMWCQGKALTLKRDSRR